MILVLSAYIPLLIKGQGKITGGQIFVGYLGLFLLGGTCLAIGVFASSLTREMVIAAVVAAIIVGVRMVCSTSSAGCSTRRCDGVRRARPLVDPLPERVHARDLQSQGPRLLPGDDLLLPAPRGEDAGGEAMAMNTPVPPVGAGLAAPSVVLLVVARRTLDAPADPLPRR
jgi:hypothetical protein